MKAPDLDQAELIPATMISAGGPCFSDGRIWAQFEPYTLFSRLHTPSGLIAVIVLPYVYMIHQQLQIHRIRRSLADQLVAQGKIEEHAKETYKMAVLDPLTSLHNRRSGEERLTEEISRAERYGRPLIVLLLDIDGLKLVNDKLGHPAGDRVIKYFAERLRKAIRGSDLAVRLGGDEFLILLPECTVAQVQHVLGRLCNMRIDLDGQMTLFTFSAGWSVYAPGELPEEVMERADAALYVSKRAGKKNSVMVE
jgi:diguanylate cyclase (GGDEF)-like protein